MAQNTDLNVSPYYDDYDETKNFHRILFRPSNAIQARELTQLQSILQNQVERFGNHVFEEGSLVMGGTITVNTLYEAVKVNAANPNGSGTATAETYRVASVGKYFRGKTSDVVGKVINSTAATSSGDPLTLYVTYVKANADSSTTTYSKFLDNEELQEVTLNAAGVYADASNTNEFKTILPSEVAGHSSSTSTGSAATVRGGVFYTRGFFVRCDEQTILLDKYSDTPTYRIGLQVTESAVSSTDDDSLLDNASGSSNENAPGANRLKIELTLVAKAITGIQDVDNFIELSRVEAGTITKQVSITAYSSIERTLARRTYDESGDYVVRPFQTELREHYNSKLNNGVYLPSNTSIPGDKSKLVAVVSSGKGYVKGFEVEKNTESFVTLDKARTKVDSGALAVPFEIGNFFNVNNTFGQPEFGLGATADITPFGTISLRDTAKANPEGADGAEIGLARVRYYNCTTPVVGSGIHTSASVFKIHLFDIRMYTKIVVQTHGTYALTAGQRVKGSVSGAKGTVVATTAASATTIFVMDVEGTFNTSDVIRLEQATTGGKTVGTGSVVNYSSDRVRQVYQVSARSGAAAFAADVVTTDSQFVLSGTCITDLSGDATADKVVTGINTKFTQELKEGDVIVMPSGSTLIVAATPAITDTTFSVLTAPSAVENGKFIRQRSQLQEQDKTVSVMATPKNFVSEITPASLVIRKQAILSLSSGTGSIGGVADEVLLAEVNLNNGDYVATIHEAEDTETNPEDNGEGDNIDLAEHPTVISAASGSNGAVSMAGANSTPLGAEDKLKVIYGATKDVADNNAAKTFNRSRGVRITSTANANAGASVSNDVYGTNINDEMITLGVPDVYAIRAIYESNSTADALPPKLTLASGDTNFAGNPGDRLSGSVSNAIGKIIQVTGSTVYFYYVSEALFTTSDTITNETSTNTSTNSRAMYCSNSRF